MRNSINIEQSCKVKFLPKNLAISTIVGLLNIVFVNPLCHAKDFRGIRVLSSFRVSQFADDDLAHDVFSMTTDSQGRIVVAGPGYVRILVDDDHDGKADRFIQYADGPKNGAQGMYFDGNDLLCIGDGGLLRYRDENGDDRADGPPELLLKLKTGGEHHTHAIRKGPDGWWYVIAGNQAGVTKKYVTMKSSPVTNPQAGVVLRIKPDFSTSEIVAHGFRNAYDFDFNSAGDLFVYDSDGERDISLPWYRPTRVFHALPGTHAGWMSASWKRPNYFFSMPPVVASLGRGSPTGVVCYQHRSFPEKYRDSLFVLDWTFGRVYFLPLQKKSATWKSQPTIFMQATGEYGFAPTDAVVDSKGDLYISVGGRGTRGGVFRVQYTGDQHAEIPRQSNLTKPLEICLNSPQPLSSWARTKWVPLAKKIGSQDFLKIILDESRPQQQRSRAIDIVTELFDGLSARQLQQLAKSRETKIRAKAIWSYGRHRIEQIDLAVVRQFLSDDSSVVQRHALEVLTRILSETTSSIPNQELITCLGANNRTVRQAASNCVSKLKTTQLVQLERAISIHNIPATIAFHLGQLHGNNQFRDKACRSIFDAFLRAGKIEHKRDALRAMQLAIGGLGKGQRKTSAVFHGYHSTVELSNDRKELYYVVPILEKRFPNRDRNLNREMSRLTAMLQPDSSILLHSTLAQITEDSHPTDDIHYLIVASQIRSHRKKEQTSQIANALLNLETKIKQRHLKQDNNWDSRILELYRKLVSLDASLPKEIVQHKQFGLASHIKFLAGAKNSQRQLAINTIAKRIHANADYEWSPQTVFLLGESAVPAHRKLLREQAGNLSLRPAVLQVLARNPKESDRELFLSGLSSSRLNEMDSSLNALQHLEPKNNAKENLAYFKTLRRLGNDRSEFAIREKVVRLLRRNTSRQFGFQFGKKGHNPQSNVMNRWNTWLRKEYPSEYQDYFSPSPSASKIVQKWMTETPWDSGNALRGKILFKKQACAQCHGRRRALGPDLAGITSRFSRKDLLTAIVDPNRVVSPRYQTTSILTTKGKIYSGLIIYESIDGITLQDSSQGTIRIDASKIEAKRKSSQSLMPENLLKDANSQDVADLFAYLKTLVK